MPLFRLYAYSVDPQRTIDPKRYLPPVGGAVTVATPLNRALATALTSAQAERPTRVDLRVDPDPTARTSAVRNAVIQLAFAPRTNVAETSAAWLAGRLSRTMDNRSPSCLFLAAAFRETPTAPSRDVALWIFPQDEAFRFRSQAHAIDLLNDVFSRTSRLRKLALFSGRDLRTDFLVATVLDFQAGGIGGVADFWIDGFLGAGLAITPDTGTRLVADAFRNAARADLSYDQREQLHAAVMAIRNRPPQRSSLQGIAAEFLSPGVAEPFLAAAPNPESARSLFQLNRQLFDRSVNYRNFRLTTGVWVSAPLGEVGDSVTITRMRPKGDDATAEPVERLHVEGTVIEDKLTSRRA